MLVPPLPVFSLFLAVGFRKLVILTTIIRQPPVPCAVLIVVRLPAGAASPRSPAAWPSSPASSATEQKLNRFMEAAPWSKKHRAQLRGTSVCARSLIQVSAADRAERGATFPHFAQRFTDSHKSALRFQLTQKSAQIIFPSD
jgi:hypothetical protein